jgi:hypothetical protein
MGLSPQRCGLWCLSMAKRIYVGPGRYALVDDEDAERVAQTDWFPVHGRTVYARTGSTRIGSNQRLMHRLIMRAPVGTIIDHINGDGLDNRKGNLRFATASENALNRFDHTRLNRHRTSDKQQFSPFQLPAPPETHPLKQSPLTRRRERFRKVAKRQLELSK